MRKIHSYRLPCFRRSRRETETGWDSYTHWTGNAGHGSIRCLRCWHSGRHFPQQRNHRQHVRTDCCGCRRDSFFPEHFHSPPVKASSAHLPRIDSDTGKMQLPPVKAKIALKHHGYSYPYRKSRLLYDAEPAYPSDTGPHPFVNRHWWIDDSDTDNNYNRGHWHSPHEKSCCFGNLRSS